MPEVVVVGGGIIGLASALALAGRGLEVTVIERDVPGRGAAWAAGGMLSPLAETRQPGPFLDLALASADRYAAFAAGVSEAAGLDVEYEAGGKLQVALNGRQAEELIEQHRWQVEAGHAVALLERDDALTLEPALSPETRIALLIPEEHRVDSRRLGRALWLACVRAGVRFHVGAAAVELRSSGGTRVEGVALDDGGVVPAGWVVVAAGSWSGGLGGLPRPLPIRPVRGQMAAIDAGPLASERVLLSPGGCYLVPRADGRVVVGSTMESAGFRAIATAGGVGALLTAAVDLVPALAGAPVSEVWAGLRPGTPDGLPVLGPDPDLEGLVYATGHLRNGVLLAPITGEIVASLVTGTTPPLPVEAFAPERFAALPAS